MSNDQRSNDQTQVGQTVTYYIGERNITLKPLPLGKMKRATMIFTNDDNKAKGNMDLIVVYLAAILENGQNDGLTADWIMENVTLPEAQKIIDDSRAINGLGSFFQKGAVEASTETQERSLVEITPTPSA